MAGNVRLKFNAAAFTAILNGSQVTAHVEAVAESIAATANAMVPRNTHPGGEEPFAVAVHHMPTRVIANVYTRTYDGQHAEYHHRTLSRCLP